MKKETTRRYFLLKRGTMKIANIWDKGSTTAIMSIVVLAVIKESFSMTPYIDSKIGTPNDVTA